MNLFNENIETLPKNLLIKRYFDIERYAKYLEAKIYEYEKYLNVETLIRQRTPFIKFYESSQIKPINEIEIVRIPERKFYVNKPYVRDVQEIINKYMRGE